MDASRVSKRVIVSPGPVHIFPAARERLVPMHHRSDEFRNLVIDVERMLRELAGTSSPVYLLTASGTGAMEAAIANVTARGSRVLVVSGGKFGRRWMEVCDAYECRTDAMHFDGGRSIDVGSVVRKIRADRPEFVALTHVESSTGLLAPVREIASELAPPRPILVVDAISSLGAEELAMDEWGLDVVVCASQKSFAAPPGMSFVIMGERARALSANRTGTYYFDLKRCEAGRERGDTPFTPAIETLQIMHRSLSNMRQFGFGHVIRRHARASAAFLAAAERYSLCSYSEKPSSAVQVLMLPEKCQGGDVLARLDQEGFGAAGGQDELRGKVVRTGFLGLFDTGTLLRFVAAVGKVLGENGCPVDVPAAERCIREGGIDLVSEHGEKGLFSGFEA